MQHSAPISVGAKYEHSFTLSENDVVRFMDLSGDTNIIHSDVTAAKLSAIGAVAVPGFLSAMVFSRILGTLFPGHGTVYKKQVLEWRQPMFVEVPYTASVSVLELFPERHSAYIFTEIIDALSHAPTLTGTAEIVHLELL